MKAFDAFKKDFQGKKVLILGLGLLGRTADVAKTFVQVGSRVTVSDLRSEKELKSSLTKLSGLPITYRLGQHSKEDLVNTDALIRNPAVPWGHPMLKKAKSQGVPILMDAALFARYYPGTLVGVTGTRGKTTTTQLIFNLLKTGKKGDVFLAGNATKEANVRLLKVAGERSIAVAELSSWELQGFRRERKSPKIALVTNIYEDHLNRHVDMQSYVFEKEAIFSFQKESDHLLLNRENHWTRAMAKKARSQIIWFSKGDLPSRWKLRLPGDHNRENAAAALNVGKLFKVNRATVRKVLTEFPGLEHRLETVERIKGVKFVNDTTSTTPIATMKALETIDGPIILLVGGNSKNLSTAELARRIGQKTKAVVLLQGNGTEELKHKLVKTSSVPILSEDEPLKTAVEKAAKAAVEGDTVLLSPGFTSFGEFPNELARGDRFKQIVRQLAKLSERRKR